MRIHKTRACTLQAQVVSTPSLDSIITGKKQRTPKEYSPAVGTANYAFLVVLYMGAKQGVEYETKDSLMTKVSCLDHTFRHAYPSLLGHITKMVARTMFFSGQH